MSIRDDLPSDMTLAGEPGLWEVTLRSGEVVLLRAHAYAELEAHHVFSWLIEDTPFRYVECARIPAQLVETVFGG